MNERIKIIESAGEDTDFYDGMIITAYEKGMDFSGMNLETVTELFARTVYYLDILKYKDSPNKDSDKYEEAQQLGKKLGINIDIEWIQKFSLKCGQILMSQN